MNAVSAHWSHRRRRECCQWDEDSASLITAINFRCAIIYLQSFVKLVGVLCIDPYKNENTSSSNPPDSLTFYFGKQISFIFRLIRCLDHLLPISNTVLTEVQFIPWDSVDCVFWFDSSYTVCLCVFVNYLPILLVQVMCQWSHSQGCG